jgi:seryl-tRNA synthetase
MKNKHERKEWNKRWLRQMAEWHKEARQLMAEAKALTEQANHLAKLIELAKSQLESDPPE